MFIKTLIARQPVVSIITTILGFVVSMGVLLIHELLHAIVYPTKATVTIGIIPKQNCCSIDLFLSLKASKIYCYVSPSIFTRDCANGYLVLSNESYRN